MTNYTLHKNTFILILISPVLGLYQSVKKLPWQYRKWSLIFFVTVFGAILQYPEEADSSRHQQNVYDHYMELSFSDFTHELKQLLLFKPIKDTNDDVFVHVISYFVGAVLHIPTLFFVIVSFVFGYFYINALSKILVWQPEAKRSLYFIALVILMITYRGIDNINFVRYWTAGWILFNGVFGYYQTGKRKYLLLMLVPPLVHVAYFVVIIPAFLVIFIRKLPPVLFMIIYISSFFISLNPSRYIQQMQATELGESKVKAYYHEDGVATKNKRGATDSNWYAKLGKAKSLHWGTNMLIGALFILGLYRKTNMTDLELGLFATGLMLATFANLGDFIGAFYNRTLINAGMYILASTVLILLRSQLFIGSPRQIFVRKVVIGACLLVFLPHFVFTLSNLLQYTSVFILGFPFAGWLLPNINISMREFIGWFI